ncbi:hypothetical protein Tco_0799420 [Tanacetum coccineum]|uniref:Uncharacterized protein n=1 Tax=Tanacetum coccineum TaxID=301880 RepID=A0ABQ4ZTJ0_9ASTR
MLSRNSMTNKTFLLGHLMSIRYTSSHHPQADSGLVSATHLPLPLLSPPSLPLLRPLLYSTSILPSPCLYPPYLLSLFCLHLLLFSLHFIVSTLHIPLPRQILSPLLSLPSYCSSTFSPSPLLFTSLLPLYCLHLSTKGREREREGETVEGEGEKEETIEGEGEKVETIEGGGEKLETIKGEGEREKVETIEGEGRERRWRQ